MTVTFLIHAHLHHCMFTEAPSFIKRDTKCAITDERVTDAVFKLEPEQFYAYSVSQKIPRRFSYIFSKRLGDFS